MKFTLPLIIFVLLITSCAHKRTTSGVAITTASSGLMKNHSAGFPVYLTDQIENRADLVKKYTDDIYMVHTGHILKASLSKAENEKILESLSSSGFNLVNLTLEDFIIADAQKINLETYDKILFINSSVIDLNLDALATASNITTFAIHEGAAFIGLSDERFDKQLSKEKYIISDYVLSILKVKREALKLAPPGALRTFIIVHTLGSEINDVMVRLPPSFINSLAN